MGFVNDEAIASPAVPGADFADDVRSVRGCSDQYYGSEVLEHSIPRMFVWFAKNRHTPCRELDSCTAILLCGEHHDQTRRP